MKKSATKKNYSFAIGFVFLLVLLAALVVVLFIPNKKQEAVKEIVKPTIAFVNEDVPADFNNESYSFGKSFVDLVSNDMDYNWQVVSRAVADRAYGDKSVDAVIYLPQTFSRDILTLQDIEPTKAQVEYKVQRQSDKLSDKMLQSKIGEVLYDFNQRVVKMYYASVANNIAEAESNMNAFVGDQEKLVVNLESQVNDPFKEALPGYSVLLSGATGLKSMNEANVSLQNGFTQVTTDMLKRAGETFDNQLPQVTEYFELQKKISTINVVNGNKGISDQAVADQKFYHNQFTTLYDNTRAGLMPFYSKNKTGDESGLLGELKQKISHYNTRISSVSHTLKEQEEELKAKEEDLLLLEKELFWQFFGVNVDVNSDNFALFSNFQTNDNAREALAQKLKSSFVNQKFLSKSGHVVQLNNLIGGISVTPSDYKLNALVENGSLTEGTKKKYEKELGLIRRYAKAYALPTGTVSLSDMPAVGDHRNQKFEAMMEITVPAKTTYQSSAFQEGEVEIQESPDPDDTTPPDPDDTTPPDPDDTTPPDPDDTTPPDPDGTTPPDPDGTTPPDPGDTTPPDPDGTTPPNTRYTAPPDPGDTTPPDPDDTTPPDPGDTTPPDPDGTTPPDPGDTTPPDPGDTTPPDPGDTTPPDPDDTTPPDTGDDAVLNPDLTVTLKNSGKVPKTYVIKLTVDLEDKTEKELVVTWMDMTNKQTVSKTTSTFGLVPEKPLDSYLGGHKFEYLTNLFNQIEVTSALISTLFGDPKNGAASLQGAVTKKDFEEASEHSIFHLYGNMDLSMLTGRLSGEDVVAFQEAGSANIKEVVKTIQGLQAASAKGQRARRTLDSQLPENYFVSNIKSLQDWYGQATASIEGTYQTWKLNDTNQLEVQSWSSYDSQEPELYIGDSSQLYKQINTLIDTTAKGAQTTVQIAREVKDNSTEFDQLLSSAAETQNEAQIILGNTNKLTSTGSQYLTLSKEYYTSFSTVLSNTRTKGVDTNKVYDFFAQPIVGENVTPKESILIEMGFDYRWALVLLIGVVFGILVTLSINVIIKRRHARLQIKNGQGYQGRQTVLRGRDEASTAYRNYAKQGASDSAL